MPLRVLITGINGFVGQHMARYLLSQQIEVVGIGRSPGHALADEKLRYERCDIRDTDALVELLDRLEIHKVIHLAGENNVANADASPMQTIQTNSFGALSVLEAARRCKDGQISGILMVGTGYEYGLRSDGQCATESMDSSPVNLYAWSKLLMTMMANMYGHLYGIPVLVARTFNLVGPALTKGVCSQLAKQVVEIERGMRPPLLQVGDISVQRDFLDVRDAVSAYWHLLQMESRNPGDMFNVCSGTAVQIATVISMLQKLALVPFEINVERSRFRQNDPEFICGDNRKLIQATGWSPQWVLEDSLRDLLHFYRKESGFT